MKKKINIALSYFLIAGIFGILLRLDRFNNIGIVYKNFLNTHSHIALLGWLYNLFLVYIQYNYYQNNNPRINKIFIASQFTFLGMLFSFPFVGYAPISIVFSTLYLFTSYWLIITLFQKKSKQPTITSKYLKTGGVFLFLSSLGPYALGYFMANKMQGSIGHHLSLYWFLHFLFNGYFTMVFLAMLSGKIQEIHPQTEKTQNLIFNLFAWSTLPLYAQFITILHPANWVYITSFVASSLQLYAFYLLTRSLIKIARKQRAISKILFTLFTISFFLKLLFQFFASLPFTYTFVAQSKPTLIIGFVHLVMLGMFTFFFLWYYRAQKSISSTKTGNIFTLLLIAGVLLSELLLFSQAFSLYAFHQSIPHYFASLFSVSLLLPLGIAGLLYSNLTKK